MATLKSIVFALLSLLSLASASVPIEPVTAPEPATELTTGGRQLLQAGCRTNAFAQCGGKGNWGPKDGVWRCCPKGFYCKKYNHWWWSCQKRVPPRGRPKPKPRGRPAPKPKPRGPKRPTPKINKRVKDGGAYNPNDWEACNEILPQMKASSHWCKYPKVRRNPTRYGLKVGRQTIYTGPVMQQLGYCNKILEGDEDKAAIAMSTKFLAKNGHMFGTDPYCGKCLCIQVLGNDYFVNPTPNPPRWKNYIGTVFKGVVKDMCPECADDAIDVLQDRGYCKAPENAGNPNGWKANRRASGKSWPMDVEIANSVGVWVVQWDWLDSCNQPCNKEFFRP